MQKSHLICSECLPMEIWSTRWNSLGDFFSLFYVSLSIFFFILTFPCTYKSSVCFQCRIFINSGCAKQEKVLRMLISYHLPKSCPFLSSSCHSLSVLCRAASPFLVVFHYLVDGCCCLLGRFPCPMVFSLSPAFSFLLVWICMFSPLFQISAFSSKCSPECHLRKGPCLPTSTTFAGLLLVRGWFYPLFKRW